MFVRGFRLVVFLLTLSVSSLSVYCQLPFFTDDADVTDKGKFHVELSNEYDWLQRSSLPGKRQNTSTFTLNYGLTDRIELGVNVPVIKIFNARESQFGDPSGIGDVQFGVKVKLSEERDTSSIPAMAVVFYAEAPTGSIRKQIGSGLADYWLYGVIQKSITKRTVARLNGGILFAGNSSIGLIGVEARRGQVFTGNGSLVRDFTKKLQLGVEVFGGVTNDFRLSRGQLEAQIGGSYSVRDNFAFTFGLLGGRFPASPRVGFQLGCTYDFN